MADGAAGAGLPSLDQQLADVTVEIGRVQREIDEAVEMAEAATDKEDRAYYRSKEKQLRTKEEQLRTEKEQLRTEKEQLRTKEELLLRDRQQLREQPQPRSDYLLSPGVISRVKASVFAIVDAAGAGVGVGVFVGPRMALTAGHNIPEGRSHVHCFLPSDAGHVTRSTSYGERFNLRVIKKHETFDLAVLELPSADGPRGVYLQLADLPPGAGAKLGLQVALCSFLFGIREELKDLKGDTFHCRLAVSPGSIMAASTHGHFAIYNATTYAGDSGSALVMLNGALVGLHLETVNTMQNRLKAKEAQLEDDEKWKDDVEESLADLIQGGSLAGAVALLADAFRGEVQITR